MKNMLTDKEILDIIKRKIESDENLGEKHGGSGHLGYVSYKIKDYQIQQISQERFKITYRYCLYVETEFTYYPDNPPMEYNYQKALIVNRDREILPESQSNGHQGGQK